MRLRPGHGLDKGVLVAPGPAVVEAEADPVGALGAEGPDKDHGNIRSPGGQFNTKIFALGQIGAQSRY